MPSWIEDVPGHLGYPAIAWRNLAQGTLQAFDPTGSGIITATLSTDVGILKGIVMDDALNGILTIFHSGGTKHLFGSGGLGAGFTPIWESFDTVLAVTTGSAQQIAFLVGTGLPPYTI